VAAGVTLLTRTHKPDLRDYRPLPPERCPLLSVIVPARNEARNIQRCLTSLRASRHPRLEIIVVDDRSGDGTGDLARRAAGADPRVSVLAGTALPEGWYGKPWACWQGYETSRGEVLLFTDADTVHAPQLHGLALAALAAERADLLTVVPHQELGGLWERVVQPFFFLLLGLRFGTPERVNRSTRPRDAIANGQFLMVTRESYQWVGGHRAVRNTVVEDLMMAAVYRRAGKRHFMAISEDLSVRMYTSLRGIVAGWTKNLFAGTLHAVGRRWLAFLAMLGALNVPAWFLVPPAALVLFAWLRAPALGVFGAASFLSCACVTGRILRASRAPVAFALLHPLGAVVLAFVLLRGAIRGTRHIEWKGRTYSHP
jgi:chlorobactene glucosyltransferase